LCGLALFVMATVVSIGPYRSGMKAWQYLYVVQILVAIVVLAMNVKQTVLLTRHITGMVALLYGAMYYANRHGAAPGQTAYAIDASSNRDQGL
jgi:hypothetical protein